MEKLTRGEGDCPNSREINAWEGRWYCTASCSEVGSKTFNRYCYYYCDYSSCPVWKREHEK